MKRFDLTSETREVDGHILHRVQYHKPTRFIGGWVESRFNLDDYGVVLGEACVYGRAVVGDHSEVKGSVTVSDEVFIGGTSTVLGEGSISGECLLTGNSFVTLGEGSSISGRAIISNFVVDRPIRIENDVVLTNSDIRFGDNAHIAYRDDYLLVGPVGHRLNYITFYRTFPDGEIHVRVEEQCCSMSSLLKRVRGFYGESSRYYKDYYNASEIAKRSIWRGTYK